MSVFRVALIAMVCGWFSICSQGSEDTNQLDKALIFLDAICKPGEPRNPELPPGNPAPSTRKMAALLKKISDATDPRAASYDSDRLALVLSNLMVQASSFDAQIKAKYRLAIEQMQSGRPDFALNNFSDLEAELQKRGLRPTEQMRVELRMRKAVSFMRLGEQENCLTSSNGEACLFPLRPQAYHLLPRGSQGAVKLLNEQLAEFPNDLTARWLLNIACMTLGQYPDGVPAQFLINPQAFASEYDMPRFPNVANRARLDVDNLAGGLIVDDFDNDGFLDVVVSSWNLRGQIRYFRNNGDGTFTQRTSEAGLVGLTGGLNLQQTDYNNDGLLDIFVLRGGWLGKAGRIPNSLLRNNGDGTFTDVTEEAGLLSFHPTQTCEWLDFDGDGWLDVFIGNESSDAADPDRCELYHNNHDGTFTEIAKECGVDFAGFVKGVTAADYDNDGRPDIYISRRDGPNLLFRNEGPSSDGKHWTFRDVSKSARVADTIVGFSTWFFDYDNDGHEDLFCSGYTLPNGVADVAADYAGLKSHAAYPKLYHNNGDGTFSDVTESAHLHRVCITMGCNFGDLENDGWLDFYLGTGDPDFRTLIPNRMFRNAGGKFFQEVTTATGTGHLQKGHGIAFADLDNDGDQDVYAVMGGAYLGDNAKNALFLNPGTTNAWVKLKLAGVRANRAAIGAQVKVTIATPEGSRSIYRRVTHGASFGANPLRLEIGLGDATAISNVEILWPGSGVKQTVAGLKLNQFYEIREEVQPRAATHAVNVKLRSAKMKASL
jgi:hypothetical protein